MRVGLVSDVFYKPDGAERLGARLREARALGAELALLPEIPLNPWSPATTRAVEEDAEPPEGRRHQAMAAAAKEASIGLVGGAIVLHPGTAIRHNTALVFDASGACVARYAKVHLPDEPGFHEPCHYEPGHELARVVRDFGVPFGIQICSDLNRPQGAHVLAAAGAAAILHPRATEGSTYERWKLVMRAVAMTACAYVLSVNRPEPEQDVALGGPSIAVDPNGDVLVETTDPIAIVDVEPRVVEESTRRYPGYLALEAGLYAAGWAEVSRQ